MLQSSSENTWETLMPEISEKIAAILAEREELLIHHPLMTGQSLLPTAQIASLCTMVYRAVLTRQLGLCFTAKSGMGKTSAMRFLATYLRQKLPRLVVYNHTCRNHKGGSVRGFFKHFLSTVGHPVLKGETADLRDRLGKTIVDAARLSGLRVAVMLIDEAQAMDVDDFAFLKDVANEIEAEGTTLITVLMAQDPDFRYVQKKLEHSSRLDLMSRFTLNPQQFRAFESEKDISGVMKQVDNALYSDSVEITWTEFFLPLAFANGFRLANFAQVFFSSMADMLDKQGLTCQIPARQLFAAIRLFVVDPEEWVSAVCTSAIMEAAAISSAGPSNNVEVIQ
jgi:hypothetical protein